VFKDIRAIKEDGVEGMLSSARFRFILRLLLLQHNNVFSVEDWEAILALRSNRETHSKLAEYSDFSQTVISFSNRFLKTTLTADEIENLIFMVCLLQNRQ
jgi:hypothetical protein